MMVLLGLLAPVGIFGALSVWFFSSGGQGSTFSLLVILLTIDVMLMRWWNKTVKMRRLQ
jgi:hypothetical protein